MSAAPPAAGEPVAPVRVFNRSDRVWVYGYLRMMPLGFFIGSILLIVLLERHVRQLPAPAIVGLVFVCLVGPVVLDRLPQFNPVNYVWLTPEMQVIRLAGGPRRYPPDRVTQIELAPREGEDYDDQQPARGGMDATIRIRSAWPARLLVSPADAVHLRTWAERFGKPVFERPE